MAPSAVVSEAGAGKGQIEDRGLRIEGSTETANERTTHFDNSIPHTFAGAVLPGASDSTPRDVPAREPDAADFGDDLRGGGDGTAGAGDVVERVNYDDQTVIENKDILAGDGGGGVGRAGGGGAGELVDGGAVVGTRQITGQKASGNDDSKVNATNARQKTSLQMPGYKPEELPEWQSFENPIFRHEVEFNQKPDGTWMQIRLRAKDGSRQSIYIGQFRIGKLTDRQLKKVGKRTLPDDVKEAIADGELEYDLIREILARPGKGATKNRTRRVSGKGARTGSKAGRPGRQGIADRTGRRKPSDQLSTITHSDRIN
jgi:hypothetical protein